MGNYDAKSDLLARLEKMTRELNVESINGFTTARIAAECHVSRSLASQYLNEFVRLGLVVKVNARPVLFLHRRGVERYVQAELDRCEFDSVQHLFQAAGLEGTHDFERAIGYELSYSTCIDHLKSAVQYPPHGLPVLLVGEHGTGKRFMSELTFEYGVNAGILPARSRYVAVDCRRYDYSDATVERDVFGDGDAPGAVGESGGGVVFLSGFDHLSHAARELLLRRISEESANAQRPDATPLPRFLLDTARPLESAVVKDIARSVPIVVSLPRLADRGIEERTALVMHFLRVEGRRVAADVSISRGALRALVNASFEDNVDGLRACITNCCAGAYLNREDELLVIHTYNLPASIIGSRELHADDDQLVSGNKGVSDPSLRMCALFQQLVEPLPAYREGQVSFQEFRVNAQMVLRAYSDYMNFEDQSSNPRISSYEQLISPIIEDVKRTYGIELTRLAARLVAQSLFTQLWGSAYLSKWRKLNAELVRGSLAAFSKNVPEAGVIVEQIAAKTKSALGLALDDLSMLLLYVEVAETLRASAGPRDYLGVIMCHGYSTATSIADAADRILRSHVFEAIDMTYEQDVSEAVDQLSQLLGRFSHCTRVAILVDMGSLESVNEAVSGLANCDVHIANNVSTALALEVGAALIAHEDLDAVFERARASCVPTVSVVRQSKAEKAMVFCSESGIEAAGKIRQLVQDSIPGDPGVRLVTCDYIDLSRNGTRASVFEDYRVCAIVGTMSPDIASIPFVALEDILYQGSSDAIDEVLYPALGSEGIAGFHSNLLRNLTLKNVFESITILNPEMLYIEADRAVQRLAELSGEQIDARRRIGVYVHLCGLIERLVTKNFVDIYPDVEGFVAQNRDFVRWFREAFQDMSRRYRVEIPVSEIAYVHHMLHVQMAERDERASIHDMILEDE